MKATLFILFFCIFSAAGFGQSIENNTAKTITPSVPEINTQPSDSFHVASQNFHPICSTFGSNDAVTTPSLSSTGHTFARLPFFINEQFSVGLGKSSNIFRYENITSFGTTFLFRPMAKLTFEISPVISHYFFGNKQLSPITDLSCNITAQYDLSEKVAVKAFGQISTSNNPNKFYGYAPFVPQNGYGVGLKYKANKNLSFEVSVEQSQYNGMWYRQSNPAQNDYQVRPSN
jgi:hypothetical protein